MSKLLAVTVLREEVPSAMARIYDPDADTYAMLNSVVVSNLSPTAPAVVICKTALADQTTGSLPNSAHVCRMSIAPEDSVQLLDAALLLEEGESLCLSQEGGSIPVVIRANVFVYSVP